MLTVKHRNKYCKYNLACMAIYVYMLACMHRTPCIMNRLTTDKRTRVIAALVEGVSINAITRMTGVSKVTILRLLEQIGCACAEYHNRAIRNLRVRRVQCDEIWPFVYAKQKNVTEEHWVTPAMEAGLTDHVWSLNELIGLLSSPKSALEQKEK